MKARFNLTTLRRSACQGLPLVLAWLLCASAPAQNLLKNGDFESPFPVSDPTAGWALVYADGGPDDFAITGPSTEASRGNHDRGAHIRPNNYNYAHAYFKQVVTNLTAGSRYTLTILKMAAGFQNYCETRNADNYPLLQIYTAVISGSTSNVVFGYATNDGPYSLTITAAASGQIEVQLHNWKQWMANESSQDMKHTKCSGWWDDLSLQLSP